MRNRMLKRSYHQWKDLDNSPSLKRGDSPTYTLRGFRVWSSCFSVATNVSTPQADTECPSANIKYSSLRYKKQEKFASYIPIDKARGFTALSGKRRAVNIEKRVWNKRRRIAYEVTSRWRNLIFAVNDLGQDPVGRCRVNKGKISLVLGKKPRLLINQPYFISF